MTCPECKTSVVTITAIMADENEKKHTVHTCSKCNTAIPPLDYDRLKDTPTEVKKEPRRVIT